MHTIPPETPDEADPEPRADVEPDCRHVTIVVNDTLGIGEHGRVGFAGFIELAQAIIRRARGRLGRPPGSGYVTSADNFRERVFPIIRAIDATGQRPTQQAVCEGITLSWPEYSDGRSSCDPRLLRQWVKQYGWRDWDAVVVETRWTA